MKKALISLATLAFAGVVLASCSSNSLKTSKVNVSKPSQGKTVDEVTVKYGDESVKFTSDQDFDTVVNSIITLNSGYNVAYPTQFKRDYTYEESYDSTNDYNVNNVEGVYDSYSYKENSHYTTEKFIQFVEGSELATTYNKNIYYDYYTYNMTQTKINGYNHLDESASQVIRAGNATATTTGLSIDGANYSYKAEKNKDNTDSTSAKSSSKDEYYSYLSLSQNFDDEDFGKRFYAQNENGTKSYSIDSYLSVSTYDYESIDFFGSTTNADLNDYFEEVSFTLAEDKIIIKAKSNLTEEAYDYAYYKYSLNGGDFATILSDVMDNEFNGSYTEAEAWLSFDDNSDRDNPFTLAYYKMEVVNKYNIEQEITEKILGEYATDFKDYIGKTYTKVGSTKYIYEMGISNDNYDKKIDSFISKAKKNNAFDGLVFTSQNSLW